MLYYKYLKIFYMSLYEYGIKKEQELMPIIDCFMVNRYGKL